MRKYRVKCNLSEEEGSLIKVELVSLKPGNARLYGGEYQECLDKGGGRFGSEMAEISRPSKRLYC